MSCHIREGFSARRKTKTSVPFMNLVTCVSAEVQNFNNLSSFRNPNSDDSIFECFLTAMATIQDEDRKAAFVFVGDFHAHHREWLGSVSPTDSHGRAALDFVDVSG